MTKSKMKGGETSLLIPFGLYKQRLGLSQSHYKPQRYEAAVYNPEVPFKLSIVIASRDLFAKV